MDSRKRFKKLNIQNNKKFLMSKNLTGGIVGFNLRNENSVDFLYKWNELCSNVNYIFPKKAILIITDTIKLCCRFYFIKHLISN